MAQWSMVDLMEVTHSKLIRLIIIIIKNRLTRVFKFIF